MLVDHGRPAPPDYSATLAGGLQAAGEKKRVYVVDDDRMTRRALTFSLSTAGFEALAFISGQDFLDALDSLLPGCVLLDIRMPDLDGLSVLRRIGERAGRFPVVIITGHGDIETAVRAMKLGARDFLEKPIPDAALLEVLENVFALLPVLAAADAEREQAMTSIANLTPRERQLLRALMTGLPNKTAAQLLNISVRTIEMHRSNLMHRLGAGSLAGAIRIAILAGLEPLAHEPALEPTTPAATSN